MEHGDAVRSAGPRTRTKKKPQRNDALLRYLIAHGEFEAALLFSKGQYVFYDRVNRGLRPKGISPQTLMTALIGEPVDSGWLPPGIVRWGSGTGGTFMVKFIPPCRHTLRLPSFDQEGYCEMTLPLPGLVFAGASHESSGSRGAVFYVWALADEEFRPTARLYHAPLPNVYPEGRVCWGTDPAPKVSWQTFDGAWQLFTFSRFNRSHCSGKSVREPSDVLRLLESLTSAARYPVADLVPFAHSQSVSSGQTALIRTVEAATRAFLQMEEVETE
jgi:Prokaryotic E2 family D